MKEDGLGGLPPNFMPEDMGGPKGLAYAPPDPGGGSSALRRRSRRHGRCRNAGASARRRRTTCDRLRAVASGHAHRGRGKAGAPPVWEECPGNVSFTLANGDEKATAAAFAKAAHVVSLRLTNNRLAPNAMEPRAAVGDYEPADGSFTLYTSSQAPHAVRSDLATHVFGLSETMFRVIAPDVGGGFGVKADAYPEDALVLWASRRCGRPVHWVATRADSIAGDNHARDQVVEAELALDASGKILAIRSHALHAVGAYIMSAAVAPLVYSLRYTPGVYDVQTLWLTTKAVFTHTTPLGVYRGAGRPEGNYLIERLLDRAAAVLGIGPTKSAGATSSRPKQCPTRRRRAPSMTAATSPRVMDHCMTLADWKNYSKRRAASKASGKVRGRSVSCYIEHAGIFNESMGIHFDPGGNATIIAGTHSHGQGHATAFAQLVSEWLGVPFERIRYVQGDTEKVPFGRGTYAARSSVLGGSALRLAANTIIEKAQTHGGAPARSLCR